MYLITGIQLQQWQGDCLGLRLSSEARVAQRVRASNQKYQAPVQPICVLPLKKKATDKQENRQIKREVSEEPQLLITQAGRSIKGLKICASTRSGSKTLSEIPQVCLVPLMLPGPSTHTDEGTTGLAYGLRAGAL